MHLGTTQYLLGAVLFILVFQILPDSPEENMHNIWTSINDYYRHYNVVTQYSSLKLASFHEPSQYPKLKGKGAEVKDLVLPLAHVWDTHTRGSNERSHKWTCTSQHYNSHCQELIDVYCIYHYVYTQHYLLVCIATHTITY